MMHGKTTTAAMVVIGNEILSGKVADTNSTFLARELRRAGVALERIIVIPDDIPTIADVVRACSAGYDHVFTSGGVGPTHDDMTIAGVALAFGRKVVIHEELAYAIEQAIGRKPSPAYLKMAEVPEGAGLITSDPSHFPTVQVENVYVLPGIPEIFEAKIASLRDRFESHPYHLRQILIAASEGRIADCLNATLAVYPDLMLGSYPKLADPEYQVKLTLESKDEAYVDRALDDLVGRIPSEYIVRILR
jgi:molybdenum cofactor synthesis domain-containing protein